MKYSFDKVFNRKGTSCMKWDIDERYISGNVLPMWVADMEFSVPHEIVDSIKKRLENPVFSYIHNDGRFEEITCKWISNRHKWSVKEDWILFSPSILTSMALFIQANTFLGDRVIIMPPVYYPFAEKIKKLDRVIEECPLILKNEHYEINYEQLELCAGKTDTKVLIMSNPHNPIGRVFTHSELKRVGEICRRHNILIFSDEIHADLVLDNRRHVPFGSVAPEIADITATAFSPTKSFNIAGQKASSVIIPNKDIRERFIKVRDSLSLDMFPCFAFETYQAAYKYGAEFLEELKPYLEDNREFATNYLQEYVPQIKALKLEATYLLWLDCRALDFTLDELDAFFMEKAKISMDSGHWFGKEGEGFMRMNIACPRSMLEDALNRIRNAVNLYNCDEKEKVFL